MKEISLSGYCLKNHLIVPIIFLSFFFLLIVVLFRALPVVGGTTWNNKGGPTIVGSPTFLPNAVICAMIECWIFFHPCWSKRRVNKE